MTWTTTYHNAHLDNVVIVHVLSIVFRKRTSTNRRIRPIEQMDVTFAKHSDKHAPTVRGPTSSLSKQLNFLLLKSIVFCVPAPIAQADL